MTFFIIRVQIFRFLKVLNIMLIIFSKRKPKKKYSLHVPLKASKIYSFVYLFFLDWVTLLFNYTCKEYYIILNVYLLLRIL